MEFVLVDMNESYLWFLHQFIIRKCRVTANGTKIVVFNIYHNLRPVSFCDALEFKIYLYDSWDRGDIALRAETAFASRGFSR